MSTATGLTVMKSVTVMPHVETTKENNHHANSTAIIELVSLPQT